MTHRNIIENISDLFLLFEKHWPTSEQAIFRGESRQFEKILCPSIYRNGSKHNEFEIYESFYETYVSGNERDEMFDKLHENIDFLDLTFIGLAQHHKVSTRLLDVTLNPLVALYFASSENPNEDGFVYFFTDSYLDLSLSKKHQNLKNLLNSSLIGEYHPHDDTCLFFKPEWPNTRLLVQHGAFILTKKYSETIWNGGGIFKIPAGRKVEILKQLTRFGISKESLFPSFKRHTTNQPINPTKEACQSN